ncbi:MAG TPA: hypothetical protein VFB14_07905 [Bryobacteraceae bacterium]|jgi:hypothetical protein|nr:hypothetical protein [Bryobacteraceae bacterium]HZS70218.1 hypothetical protein [Candidatus Acidoferrum sp.]
MKLASSVPGLPLDRSSRIALFFFLLAVVLAYPVAQYILSEDLSSLAMGGLAVLVIGFVIAILNDWRRGLYIFLGWLLFEDFVRKYLGNNMAIYFGKDVLVGLVYLSFFAAWRRERFPLFRPPYRLPLLLFVWLGIMQVFNPSSPHIIFGLLGVKLFFYYIPLMYVGYSFLDSEVQLRRFFLWCSLAVVVIGGLGIAQSVIGPSFLNPSHLQADIRELSTLYREAPLSGDVVYRPNSVFVSGGRFANFLILSWLMVFGFTGYLLLRHKKGRNFVFLALAATAAAVVMCASRGALMWSLGSSLVGAAAFLWGAPWKQGEALRVVRALQRALLGIGLALVLLLAAYPKALMGRLAVYSETLSPDSPASELVWRARDYPIKNFLYAFDFPDWPIGYGIGTTGLGTQYVSRFFHVRPLGGVESGFGTLIVELGIMGLVLWLIMSAAIVISAWRVVRKLRGSPWFPLAFVIFWYAFLLLFPITFSGMAPYEDFVLNAFLWLLLGILFRLPSLALSAQFAAGAAPVKPRRRWVV